MSGKLEIVKPFDAHLHLRVGEMSHLVTPMSAAQFESVIVMPNLTPPVTTVARALEYKEQLEMFAKNCNYLMTLYLTESTTKEDVRKVADNPNMIGFKLYPLNATTGSQDGISDVENVYPLFAEMEKLGVPLLIHGEVTRPEIDIFDREKVFIEETLSVIVERFPKLKVTLEHITTSDAVQFVIGNNVAASITAHHLLIDRNAMFTVENKTAMNPHAFCLPVAKKSSHKLSLISAAFSGDPKFFAGTDSAPHPISCKESSCGCAGIFTGLHAIELYHKVFDSFDNLRNFENFLSIFGRNHYGLEIPEEKIIIEEVDWVVPKEIGKKKLTPFMAGETLAWKVKGG